MKINIRVIPNGRKDEITVSEGGILKIRVRAPAVQGAANKALLKFISKTTGIPSSKISVIQGEKSRNKIIEIEGEESEILNSLRGDK